MRNTALLRRLNRLERSRDPNAHVPPLLIQVPLEDAQRALAPGERIVVDTIRRSAWLSEAHERITTDPNDFGAVIADLA